MKFVVYCRLTDFRRRIEVESVLALTLASILLFLFIGVIKIRLISGTDSLSGYRLAGVTTTDTNVKYH